MLAIHDSEMFLFVLVIAAALATVAMMLRHRHRLDRLKTIRQILDTGHLDEGTRRTLLDTLAADGRLPREVWTAMLSKVGRHAGRLFFMAGWMTFTIGGCILVFLVATDAGRYDVQAAAIATAVGFGVVSLPMALREAEARRSVRS